MKYTIHVGNKPIILEHDDLDSTINVDSLTMIDTSNIFGEAVVGNASANRIGLLRAEVEELMSNLKLDLKVFEGKFKEKLRKAAANNSGFFTLRIGNEDVKIKATEKALETAHETDKDWIKLKKDFIKAEGNFNKLSSLYWSTQNKARTLNSLTGSTTPEEFVSELIEGKLNGFTITKK